MPDCLGNPQWIRKEPIQISISNNQIILDSDPNNPINVREVATNLAVLGHLVFIFSQINNSELLKIYNTYKLNPFEKTLLFIIDHIINIEITGQLLSRYSQYNPILLFPYDLKSIRPQGFDSDDNTQYTESIEGIDLFTINKIDLLKLLIQGLNIGYATPPIIITDRMHSHPYEKNDLIYSALGQLSITQTIHTVLEVKGNPRSPFQQVFDYSRPDKNTFILNKMGINQNRLKPYIQLALNIAKYYAPKLYRLLLIKTNLRNYLISS